MVDYTRGRHRLSLKKFFARGEIIDGYFRQLERLVRTHTVKSFPRLIESMFDYNGFGLCVGGL